MIRLDNEAMAIAFAEVEYMDYLIMAAIFSEEVDVRDLWPGFPPRVVHDELNRWEAGLVMILVGLRSDSTVSVHFRLKDDGTWECLKPKEERDAICRQQMGHLLGCSPEQFRKDCPACVDAYNIFSRAIQKQAGGS